MAPSEAEAAHVVGWLRRRGVMADRVSSGSDGLHRIALAGPKIAAVLASAALPGGDAFTLPAAATAGGSGAAWVCLTTTSLEGEHSRRASESGYAVTLRRPLTPSRLFEALQAAVQRGQQVAGRPSVTAITPR